MTTAREFGAVIARLMRNQDLTREESKAMFQQILNNQQSDMHQGAFLAALTAKGETAAEIAGTWEAIYEVDTVKVRPQTEAPVVDNCGTGMDTVKTFNISTAASVVAAAAGIPMAKHGARAITSVCGTVDILEELGVDVECSPEVVKKSIEKAGIGIFNGMSPQVHPQALGRILSQISFGTVLNIAASLANPALPQLAVRGVYSREMILPVAAVMREIGYRQAMVVFGQAGEKGQGMDEASTLGETHIAHLQEDGEIVSYSFLPEDVGLNRGNLAELAPGPDRRQEAARMLAVLSGQEMGSRRDIVCLNAALILRLAGKCPDIANGVVLAGEIIDSGRAVTKLRDWVREQNSQPERGLNKLESLQATPELLQ